MMITTLNGFGCAGNPDCPCNAEQKEVLASNYKSRLYGTGKPWLPVLGRPGLAGLRGLGDPANYDQIMIGGKTYSADQILDKTVVAARDTTLYRNTKATNVYTIIKAGQPIGKVDSYLKASSPNTDGRAWLQFWSSSQGYYYAPNEAVSGAGLKDQGTKTVKEEVKEIENQKLKDDNPTLYYAKKIALPAVLLVGAIVIGKAYVVSRSRSSSSAPAAATTPLSGPPSRRKKKRRTKKK